MNEKKHFKTEKNLAVPPPVKADPEMQHYPEPQTSEIFEKNIKQLPEDTTIEQKKQALPKPMELAELAARFAHRASYGQALRSLGADAITDINQVGPLTPVSINDTTAEYYFEQTVNGQLLLFPVEFVKENGVWKILQF